MDEATTQPFDVIVLGGGAAGLFAATAAANAGASTLLIERNRRPGVKILASGGTRCNVTSALPPHEMIRYFGRAGSRFLGHAMRVLPPEAILRLLHEEGVETYTERFDKVFPKSDRATDVLAALMRRLEASGARLQCGTRVIGVRRISADGLFELEGETGTGVSLRARSVVLAVGGASYPKTGTTGDGYDIARGLGHTIVQPRPALVPLTVAASWVRELTGNAFQDVEVRLTDRAGRALATRHRPLLFTHFGLSGPAAMDVSKQVVTHAEPTVLHIDFAPDVSAGRLTERFDATLARQPKKATLRCLPVELPERVARALLASRGIDADTRASELSRRRREEITRLLKDTPVPIAGTLGFDKAEVTAGGVALEDVEPRTMHSRVCPGLFVCGEVLDVDGPIGGFNFQAAFSTGQVAGLAAADAAKRWQRM